MRLEVIRKRWRLAVVLLVGIAAGRFLISGLEPRTIHHVTIFPHEGAKQCNYGLIDVTSILGRMTRYGEGYHHLDCGQEKAFADTVIDCRCPAPQ